MIINISSEPKMNYHYVHDQIIATAIQIGLGIWHESINSFYQKFIFSDFYNAKVQ